MRIRGDCMHWHSSCPLVRCEDWTSETKGAGKTMATTTFGRVAGVTATATLGAAAGAIGGWLGLSRVLVNHQVPLPPAIDAERQQFVGLGAGPLSYYVA